MLIIGLLMIVGAIVYMIVSKKDEAGPREVSLSTTQTYTEAIVGKPLWVNPILAVSQADRDLVSLLFSGLTRIDGYGQPAPDLASNWEISSDGLTYIFNLRADVTWHDGTPFTADDVTFTMALLRDPDFPGPADLGAFWRTVETYAEDETTVKFVLTQPLSAFPEYAGIGILPEHLLGGVSPDELPSEPFNLSPIGTGRLQWASLQEQSNSVTVKLEPYANYYDRQRQIKLTDIDLRFYPDDNRAFRTLGSDVQALGGLSPAQLKGVLESPELEIYTSRLPVYAAVILNQGASTRLPFFQDVAVRKALVMALDRDGLVARALPRIAIPATSTILPGTWAYNDSLTQLSHDTTTAAQLLDEAGWVLDGSTRTKEETRLAFTLLVTNQNADRQMGEMIVQQWRELGIDVTLKTLDAEKLLDRIQTPAGEQGRDFDAALVEFSQGRMADPDPYAFWHESQIETGQNYGGFSDRDVSEALEIARKDPNGVRRAELYRSYQQRFLDQAAAVLLYNPLYHYAMSCQIQGVQLTILVDPSDRFRNMEQWQLLSPEQAQQYCSRE
ncbi:MAG: peptide ABC transporter substrate-binding protein [Anaerolineae bacterium]|nr:peptide ABC transporter substrate-binding protein [Anaerolineae bacterium]